MFRYLLPFLVITPVFAHPHVIVENAVIVIMNEAQEVRALKQLWRFDKAYSEFTTKDLGEKKDGNPTAEQFAELAKINTESLGEYGYFTESKLGKVKLAFEKPLEATMALVNGQLELSFLLPLRSPPKVKNNEFSIDVYDPSFFVQFTPISGEPLKLENAPAACKVDYKAPEKSDTKSLAKLGEVFFENLGMGNSFAKQFTGSFVVKCQ